MLKTKTVSFGGLYSSPECRSVKLFIDGAFLNVSGTGIDPFEDDGDPIGDTL